MFERSGHLLYKRFAGYFVPTVIMALALSMSIVADGIIVGNMLGPDALAAVNLVLPVTLFFGLVSVWFGLGGTILAAVELGKRRTDKANELFTVSLIALAIAGMGIGVLLVSAADPFASIITGGDARLGTLVREYLDALTWGAPLLIFAPGCVYFIRTDGQPALAAAVLVVANIINLVCDVLFIRYMGSIRGASLATVLGYALGTLLLLVYVRSPSRTLKLTFRTGSLLRSLVDILKAGFPAALDSGLLFLKITCVNALVLSLSGASGIAAFSVCLACLSLVSIFIGGVADTMIPITGVLYGEGDSRGIRLVFARARTVLLVTTVLLLILFELFPVELLGLFGVVEHDALATGVPAIRLFALSFLGTGLTYLMMAYYQTVGRPALATAVTLIEGFVVVIPAAWILSRFWGLPGIWIAFLLTEVVSLSFIYFAARREENRSGGAVQGVLLLPREKADDGVLDLTIRNTLDEAIGLSEKIRQFCLRRNVDESTANKVALAVEETAINVVKHGHDQQGKNYLDVNMRLDPDDIYLHFRDDGRPFNPLEYQAGEDDGLVVGGLRVLKALAISLSYSYTLNFNSTFIVIPRKTVPADVKEAGNGTDEAQ